MCCILVRLSLQALLPQGPDPIANTSTSGLVPASASGSMVLSSAGTTLDGSTLAGGNSRSSTLPGLNFTGSSFGIIEGPDNNMHGGPRQLSPRSLLASARAGMALVNSASLSSTPRACTPPTAAAAAALAASSPKPKPAQERFFAHQATDSDEEEDAQSEAGSSEAEEQEQEQEQLREQEEPGAAAPALSSTDHTVVAGIAEAHAGQRPALAR